MIAAYLQWPRKRREIKAAREACCKLSKRTEQPWQNGSERQEISKAASNWMARRLTGLNADIVDRKIAQLVDSLRKSR